MYLEPSNRPVRSVKKAPALLLLNLVLAAAMGLTGCGMMFNEPCLGVDEPLATPEIVVTHDGNIPILSFEGDHKGYQMGVYNAAKRQTMWSVYASSADAIGDEDYHVIGSPIRYGEADFGDDVYVEADEAFPLEDGETYTLWIGRGCSVGYGNSQNTISGDFVYASPTTTTE